jgi:hypothetical protein
MQSAEGSPDGSDVPGGSRLVDERDRHRVGADAVARDAAGGMGRIQTGHLSGQTSCRVITSVNPLGTRSPDRQSVWPRGCQT